MYWSSISHVSVMYRSCIGQVSVRCRSSIGRVSVKYRSGVGQVSVKCRSSIGQVSVKYRSSIGHVSVEYRWFKTISVDTFIGRLSADISVDYRPIVGRQSTDISADVLVTYSTHYPTELGDATVRACEPEPFLTSQSHFLRAPKVPAKNI